MVIFHPFLYFDKKKAGVILIKLMPLKGRDSFTKVFNYGKKFYDNNCLCVFVFSDTEIDKIELNKCLDINICYFGVAVGKKIIKKSTIRNRIKRLMRESIRQIVAKRYSDKDKEFFKYIIFNWKRPIQKSSLIKLSDVYPTIENLFLIAENHYINKKKSEK